MSTEQPPSLSLSPSDWAPFLAAHCDTKLVVSRRPRVINEGKFLPPTNAGRSEERGFRLQISTGWRNSCYKLQSAVDNAMGLAHHYAHTIHNSRADSRINFILGHSLQHKLRSVLVVLSGVRKQKHRNLATLFPHRS